MHLEDTWPLEEACLNSRDQKHLQTQVSKVIERDGQRNAFVETVRSSATEIQTIETKEVLLSQLIFSGD